MGFKDPCILDGGASIVNPLTEETIWSRQLSAEDTKSAVAELMQDAFLIEYDQGVKKPGEVDLTTITEPALSVWASVPTDKAEGLVEKLREKLPTTAVHGNPGPGGDFSKWGIQVTHKEADKEHAVKQLLETLGVNKANTLAIGDGNNDLPLFNGASIKVAMGNATELLKANADYVVGTVQEDGFAYAIQTLVLQ
jgi:HAD superfamily hydrolase (TIGR01484 family)